MQPPPPSGVPSPSAYAMDPIAAQQWLETKWPPHRRTCPICATNTWNIENMIAEMRQFSGGSFVIGAGVGIFPLLVVTCINCGHVLLFNAMMAGLVKKA